MFQQLLIRLAAAALVAGDLIFKENGHVGELGAVLIYNGILYTGGQDNTIRRWNATDGSFISSFLPNDIRMWIRNMVVINGYLVISGRSNIIAVRRIDDLSTVVTITAPGASWTNDLVAIDAETFVAAHLNNEIAIYSSVTWTKVGALVGHIAKSLLVLGPSAVDPNKILVSGGEDSTIRWWDLTSRTLIRNITISQNQWVLGLALHKNWVVAAVTGTGTAVFSDSGTLISVFSPGSDTTFFADSNNQLFSFGNPGIRRWETNSVPFTVQSTTGASDVRHYGQDQDHYYVNYLDCTTRKYRKSDLLELWSTAPNKQFRSVVVSNVGILVSRMDGDIFVFDAVTFSLIRKITTGSLSLRAMATDGTTAFYSNNFRIERVDLLTGLPLNSYFGHSNFVNAIVVSNELIYTASDDKTVIEWNVQSGAQLRSVQFSNRARALSIQGSQLYVAAESGTFVWDLISGQVQIFGNSLGGTVTITGSHIFTSWGNSARVQRLDTGAIIQTLDFGLERVVNQVFNGDHLLIGTSSDHPKVYLVHWPSGATLRTYEGFNFPDGVTGLAISGQTLIAASDSIHQWTVPEITPTNVSAPAITSSTTQLNQISTMSRRSISSTLQRTTAAPIDDENFSGGPDSTLIIIILACTGGALFATAIILWIRHFIKRSLKSPYRTIMPTRSETTVGTLPSMDSSVHFSTTVNSSSPGRTVHSRAAPTNQLFGSEMSTLYASSNPTSSNQTSTGVAAPFSNTQTATIFTQSIELSVPAFLEVQVDQDFSMGKFLARGGMGQLFLVMTREGELARRAGSYQVIAKVAGYSLETIGEKSLLAFLQELSIAWRFRDHPNILRVFGYCSRPAALLMKFYEMGDSTCFIQKRGQVAKLFPYSKRNMLRILSGIYNATAYMHQNGFVHCDIKPMNFLLDLTADGRLTAVLTDFGISRVIDGVAIKVQAFHVSEIRGASLLYAAPETIVRFRKRLNDTDPLVWKAGDAFALSASLCEFLKRTEDPWSR